MKVAPPVLKKKTVIYFLPRYFILMDLKTNLLNSVYGKIHQQMFEKSCWWTQKNL